MVWAGAALMVYNLFPALMSKAPGAVLSDITGYFLGKYAGTVTVLSVIILAVTSGDTAMRSLRLSLAEICHLPQKKIYSRITLCLPLIVIVSLLLWWSNKSAATFNQLWNYFAWGNQVLAASTLMAAAVWLFKQKRNGFTALIPGMFMTFIIVTYILWTSPVHKQAYGFGLPVNVARAIGVAVAILFAIFVWRRVKTSSADDVTIHE
jgi:carbon starvation protein CstA